MKDTLKKMEDETRIKATAEFLVLLNIAIDGLSEIKPLDKTLLDRIDRLKVKG